MLRTTVLPGTLWAAVRREVQTLDADLPIFNLWMMEERLQRNYSFTGVIGSPFAIFAAVALVLASVGLYAVIRPTHSRLRWPRQCSRSRPSPARCFLRAARCASIR
jgi:hypothetical protein